MTTRKQTQQPAVESESDADRTADAAPLVSAIIPAYDRPQRLRRALRSVVEQTYEPIEAIVVDDHSPTPLCEVVDALPTGGLESVTCLRKSQNEGGSAARNAGIEAARGRYVAFLDDDDEWKPSKIERQVAILQGDVEYGAVYVGVQQVDEQGRTNITKLPSANGDLTRRLLRGNFIGTFSVMMVDRDVIDDVGLLDERFPSWQDWEWYVRLSRATAIASVPEPLVVRHNSEHRQISDNHDQKRNVTFPLFLEKYRPLAAEYGTLFERKMVATATWRVGRSALSSKRMAEARKYHLKAWLLYPFDYRLYPYLAVSLFGESVYDASRATKRAIVRILE